MRFHSVPRRSCVAIAILGFAATCVPVASDVRGHPPEETPARPGVQHFKDLAYVEAGHAMQKLDLYLPEKRGDLLPLIVYIHGGAFRSGDKSPCPIADLTAHGFAVASVNYRLSQHAVFPAQIADVKAAVRWLRAHATEHGLDPRRFGACGHSAGGHLAALLGTSGDVEELEGDLGNAGFSSRVEVVADFFGPTDFLRMNAQAGELSRMDHDAPDSPESQLIGGALQQNPEKARRANPITYASSDDPPFLIVHGEKDPFVPIGQSRVLQDALVSAGVSSTLHIVPGGGHGDFNDPAIPGKLLAFFEARLKGVDWPAWRGPTGDGVSPEVALPIEWSRTKNVKWRVALPEPGNSTPIVWGDRVFVTQPVSSDKRRTVMAFDRRDGHVLWQSGITTEEREPTHATNPYCSPSAVTDGERVIVWFGAPGLFAYDLDGKLIWRRELGRPDHVFGIGSSPVLRGELCYLNFGPGDPEYLVAVKKATGEIAWVTDARGERLPDIPGKSADRPRAPDGGEGDINGTWSTPIIVESDRRELVVCCFRDLVTAQDPATGALVWKCRGMGPQTKASPVAGEGVVVALGGKGSTSVAVKLGGAGDVSATYAIWKEPHADSRLGTGVIAGGRFYSTHRNGLLECRDLRSGEVIWKERLQGPEGASDIWSSLFLAAGRIYALNQTGDTFVVGAGGEFKLLATSSLDEPTNSSLVASRGQLFIRTHAALWCIGE